MDRKDAIAWMLLLCATGRLSQAQTLSEGCWAKLRCRRAGIGELGRWLAPDTGLAAKQAIKRVDRLSGNVRDEPAEADGAIVHKFRGGLPAAGLTRSIATR